MGRVRPRDVHAEISEELLRVRTENSTSGSGLTLQDLRRFEPQVSHILWKIERAWDHSWELEDDGKPYCVGQTWYGSGSDGMGGLRFMVWLLTGPHAKVKAEVLRSWSAYIDALADAHRLLPPCDHPGQPCWGQRPHQVLGRRRGY